MTRSRDETRARLLDAARARFQAEGFDGATVRGIASDAGVDAALIIRYFGSKEALFAEVTLSDVTFEDLLAGDRSSLGRRMAELVTSKGQADPAIETMLRSLGNPAASSRYEESIEERFVAPLAHWLGGRDAQVRAGLIVSILNGLTLSIAVLGQRSLRQAARETLVRRAGQALQVLIDG